jgi:hypothetical protein
MTRSPDLPIADLLQLYSQEVSPELFVMTAPQDAYRRLSPGYRTSPLAALKRPALVAIILGVVVSIYATGRVTVSQVLITVLCWSFAAALQTLAGLALVASAKRRSVGIPAGIDLLFVGHGPWSLWLLAVAAWAVWLPRPDRMDVVVAATAAVPLVWTAVILFAFCRTVLGDEPRQAAIRTLLHQLLIWTVAGVYIAVVVQLWPRLAGIAAS